MGAAADSIAQEGNESADTGMRASLLVLTKLRFIQQLLLAGPECEVGAEERRLRSIQHGLLLATKEVDLTVQIGTHAAGGQVGHDGCEKGM